VKDTAVVIRAPRADEHAAWRHLRSCLWPDSSEEDLAREAAEILAESRRNAVLVAVTGNGDLAGFIEISIRDWAEGCHTRPVGYIEGWYVAPEQRRSGIGRRLVEAAEQWALGRGCTEMGSDADLTNQVSRLAHGRLGYEEVDQVVLFRKALAPPRSA
jgi:aminoglycoside 6'-N-acetyltransferase I